MPTPQQEAEWAELAKKGPAGAQAANYQRQEQMRLEAEAAANKPESRWETIARQLREDEAADPEAAARRKAEAEQARQLAEQRKKESAAMQYFRDQSASVQNRQLSGTEYGGQISNDRRAFQQGMNTDNAQSLALLRGAAEGNAPSASAIQQNQGLSASIRAGMGAQANAGPTQFARTNAMLGGATQAGQAAQNVVQQGGLSRAQEMSQARGAYGQATDARASQYQALRNQEIDMAMKQREANDKASFAWYGLNQQQKEANKANDFQEFVFNNAKQQNANIAAVNNAAQGLGAASGLANAGFQYAGALSKSPEEDQKDGIVYDDYGRPIRSDVHSKSDVQTSRPHLLAQWRAR